MRKAKVFHPQVVNRLCPEPHNSTPHSHAPFSEVVLILYSRLFLGLHIVSSLQNSGLNCDVFLVLKKF